MGIAKVQAVPQGSTTSSGTLAVTATVTAGHGLILLIGGHISSGSLTVSGVSDTHNTWAHWTAAQKQQGVALGDIWYCKNVTTGGALTITITYSAACGAVATLIEVSGQDTATFIDQVVAGSAASGTAMDSGAFATGTADPSEFVIGLAVGIVGNTFSAQAFSPSLTGQAQETLASATAAGIKASLQVSDGIAASAGSKEDFTATLSATGVWIAICASFLPVAAAAPNSGFLAFM